MKLYVGIDLHSNNHYLGIIDEENKAVFRQRLRNDLGRRSVACPFRRRWWGLWSSQRSTGIGWWMVDGPGLPSSFSESGSDSPIQGLKHVDDKRSALWLANLLRLGILPEGYIYPKEERPVRDLLRKRSQLVRHRTAHILRLRTS